MCKEETKHEKQILETLDNVEQWVKEKLENPKRAVAIDKTRMNNVRHKRAQKRLRKARNGKTC